MATRFPLTRTRVAILVVVLAAAGFGIWKWTQRGPKPVEVQTAVVARADLQAKVTANGKIQAQRKVDISATIAGQITHLAVREGDRVTQGAVPPRDRSPSAPAPPRAAARPPCRPCCARSTRRGPTLAQARLDIVRAEANFQARIIPEMEVQRARTAVATAEAGAERGASAAWSRRAPCSRARATPCRRRSVRSPIEGIVTAQSRRGRRGGGGGRAQPAGHGAAHDLGHVGGGGGGRGGRDLDPVGQGRAGGPRPRRRLPEPYLHRHRDGGGKQPDPQRDRRHHPGHQVPA